MIDQQRNARIVGGGHHAIGVGERGGDWLFAEDASHTRVNCVDHDLGVGVVAGDDADDVQVFRGQHGLVIGICAKVRQQSRPLLLEVGGALRTKVAAGDEFRVRHAVVGGGVGHRQPDAQAGTLGRLRQPCGYAGQANNAGSQRSRHTSSGDLRLDYLPGSTDPLPITAMWRLPLIRR